MKRLVIALAIAAGLTACQMPLRSAQAVEDPEWKRTPETLRIASTLERHGWLTKIPTPRKDQHQWNILGVNRPASPIPKLRSLASYCEFRQQIAPAREAVCARP
jgi:hypothetical protein